MRLINNKQSLTKPLVWLEINKQALLWNVGEMKRLVGDRKIMAVLKANAYGLGAVGIAKTIEPEVDYIGVVGVAEALSLRNEGVTKPIVNLGIYCHENADTLITNFIIPSIFTMSDARQYAAAAQKLNQTAKLWIKVDTGLGRLGVECQQALQLIRSVTTCSNVVVDGIYSTLAEDTNFDKEQLRQFLILKKQCEREGVKDVLWSIASSQGAMLFEESRLTMVRLGISLLGYYPSEESKNRRNVPLAPCATYKTRVACIKELEKGESLFYRRTFIAKQKTRIAVLLPGYSYGLSSSLVNGGVVLIRGKRYSLVGGISATNCFVDIGLDTSIDVNDEVVFFGIQNKSRIDLEEVCRITEQSSYECLSRIPEKVRRIYV